MDNVEKTTRSAVMRRVKSKNTKPELIVRRLLHSMDYRYRLHVKSLPGCPDIVFTRRKKVIFVHGCLWHGHEGCPNNRRPNSRQEYWIPKLDGNITRDIEHNMKLRNMGWDILVIWECETKNKPLLRAKISCFLESK